jgi:hypothetical protein
MWAAFLTGAATKATSLIEERDKEIQDDITLKINEMYKSAQETKKKAETRADKLREFASQLKALGFSDDEAVAVISSGEANTENVINLATEKAKVSPVTAEERTGLLPGGVKSMPGGIQEFIRKQTTPVVPEGATLFPRDQMRGAFGLPTDAATRTTKSLLARTGMTEEQLLGRLPEPEFIATPLDFSVFTSEKDKPKGVVELENKLADIAAVMPGATTEERMKNAVATEEGQQLQAQIAGRTLLEANRKAKADTGEKQRSTDQIRRLVTTRLQEEIAPLQFKEIRYDANIQDFVVDIPGSPEAKQFLEMRRGVVADVFQNAGLLQGNKLVDRNAADAISPFAVVDYDTLTIRSWRPVAGTGAAPGTPAPVAGTKPPVEAPVAPAAPPARQPPAAPVAPVAPAPRPANAPANSSPIPRTSDGKVDRAKLKPGTVYYSSTGEVRIWNGTNFQPYTPPK